MSKVVRVLHVLPRLSLGGITIWLARVYSEIDRERFVFDFAVHRPNCGPYAEEFARKGSNVFRLPDRRNVFAYCSRLRHILRVHGPYDVVHAHYHVFNGLVLAAATWAGVPVRIAHAWTTSDRALRTKRLTRLIGYASRTLLRHVMTLGMACGTQAATALFGPNWNQSSRPLVVVLPGGIDPHVFQATPRDETVRRALGIPPSSLIIGHVGNFLRPKNHTFLLEVFAAIARRRPDSLLVLVGDGELKQAICHKACELGISGQVRLLGFRRDVPVLLKSVFDVFVFPSLWEGLPIAVVEAQMAGLPALVSDVVTKEVAISSSIRFLSLREPASVWAEAALELAHRGRCVLDLSQPGVIRYTLQHHIATLQRVYGGEPLQEEPCQLPSEYRR